MHSLDSHRPLILVVDDAPESIEPIVNCLHNADFRTRIATRGERALQLAASTPVPDLILLDVTMPDMDGYEVCSRLMNNPATASIPVIFLSIRNEELDEQRGFDAGAVDYITKPISPPLVLTRIRNHLTLKAASDFLRDRNAYLEQEAGRRTRELALLQDATIVAMASLAETRDNETTHHIRRTQLYLRTLARHLQHHPRFAAELSDQNIDLMYKSAPLHDIGKVGVPDSILLKPGRLTPEEFSIMKSHPVIGADAITKAMEQALSGVAPGGEEQATGAFRFLEIAREISLGHHEKWDGSGYPAGLAGEAIPVSARLMALADVFDALISRRVYKAPIPFDTVREMIAEERGHHFDPDIAEVFVAGHHDFEAIALYFGIEN